MRAGVEGRVQLRTDLLKWLKEGRQEFNDFALELGLDAGEKARDSMRNTIETTPSGLAPGKPNRILTGAMWDAADYSVTQAGYKVRVRHGWLKSRKRYFLDQELGTGGVAFGMYGLTKAQQEAIKLIEDRKFK